MPGENKQCQNCKKNFTIESEDFDFYKKIDVPPPTFCPRCRFQRRLSFFNQTSLYRRPCDLCKKESVSMYSLGVSCKVYCPKCWWSDNWDPFEYGRDYDFSRSFFEQFKELWQEVPMLGLSLDTPTIKTSPYNNHAGHLKNCYLVFNGDYNEDCAYGSYLNNNKGIINCSLASYSEYCYDSQNIFKDNRIIGSNHVNESIDCAFLSNSRNCQNCFASINLYNKKYYIFNKPYTKEEYENEIKKWDLGSYSQYKEIKRKAEEHWGQYSPRPRWDDFSNNCTGNYVFQSKNCHECYEVVGAQDCKFIFSCGNPPIKNSYDISSWGNNLESAYECCIVGENTSGAKFCQECGINAYDIEYSKLSTGGSNHLGCVSIKKGDYCIFNRRYSREEYQKLREKIIDQMKKVVYTDKRGRKYGYGEFFPVELSPWAYNETIAQKFIPMNKEGIERLGFKWRIEESRKSDINKKGSDLPDHIKDVPDSILNDVIKCESCYGGFRIIKMELDFLRKMNLPISRECPFCRIDYRLTAWAKNLFLNTRECSECGEKFDTPFTKNETPKIFCKDCYSKKFL